MQYLMKLAESTSYDGNLRFALPIAPLAVLADTTIS